MFSELFSREITIFVEKIRSDDNAPDELSKVLLGVPAGLTVNEI